MYHKKPPFTVTDATLDKLSEIAELVGQASVTTGLPTSPMLRRMSRIRSIYSSLAIEQNTLSLEQVTAVLNGKRVIAPPKDIVEVQNAYEIYDILDTLNPYSVDDLLRAHGVMTRNLVAESGCFRSGPVGVVDKQGRILHFGTLPDYVPALVMELLDWVQTSPLPMLIKSCVFHYELELIHPFADGNGRMGRLWHTLLLTQWNPLFAWIPVESIIHSRQEEYYTAINQSNALGESTPFLAFMLSAIQEALTEAVQLSHAGVRIHTDALRWYRIESALQRQESITNADVCQLLQVSPSTATRLLSKLTQEGKLQRVRLGRSWAYVLSQGEQHENQ